MKFQERLQQMILRHQRKAEAYALLLEEMNEEDLRVAKRSFGGKIRQAVKMGRASAMSNGGPAAEAPATPSAKELAWTPARKAAWSKWMKRQWKKGVYKQKVKAQKRHPRADKGTLQPGSRREQAYKYLLAHGPTSAAILQEKFNTKNFAAFANGAGAYFKKLGKGMWEAIPLKPE